MGFQWYHIAMAVLIVVAALVVAGYAFPAAEPVERGTTAGWSPILMVAAADLVGDPAPLPETTRETRQVTAGYVTALAVIEQQFRTDLDDLIRVTIDAINPGVTTTFEMNTES